MTIAGREEDGCVERPRDARADSEMEVKFKIEKERDVEEGS